VYHNKLFIVWEKMGFMSHDNDLNTKLQLYAQVCHSKSECFCKLSNISQKTVSEK